MSFRYYLRFHKNIDWKNPRTLNEKILYLSLMTDTSVWTLLADKYRVGEYLSQCGCDKYLVNLYGIWNNANDIDFNQLPQSFILKTNHGCGGIKIIKDKNTIDKKSLIFFFNKAVNRKYGAIESGKHYLKIQPCIIAEQLLLNDSISEKYSSSIIDYKFWCFNGKVHYVLVCSNRTKKSTDLLLYDKDWNAHPEYSVFTNRYHRGNVMQKPKNYTEMIYLAETLAQPFPCVRVDLYNIDGKIYFGEMTFTSLGGLMNYFSVDFLLKSGDLIDLNYKGKQAYTKQK